MPHPVRLYSATLGYASLCFACISGLAGCDSQARAAARRRPHRWMSRRRCSWAVVTAMLQSDWRRPTAPGTLGVFAGHLPFYGMLTNNQRASREGLR